MNSFYSKEELNKLGLKKVGDNVLISRKCSIYNAKEIIIGNNVRIDDFCILSGKIKIGNYVHVSAGVMLFAGEYGIILKNYSSISSRCAIYALTDDYSGEYMVNSVLPDEVRNVLGGQVVLEEFVSVGTGCTILPNVIIKKGAAVGAMSLVNKNIEEYTINVGIPCKKIKNRKKNMLQLAKKIECG